MATFAWAPCMPTANFRPKLRANSPRWRSNFRAPTHKRRPVMSIINYASKEIQFKIVYYGPALCGKTTTLIYIHSRLSPNHRGDLISLATAADRTLFFDFLPVNAASLQGFKTKFQLYTVPGQVIYNATRQLVLRSVDGVVFVADSQWDKMQENVEGFRN